MWLNSLPNNKISDISKLKAIADADMNIIQKFEFVLGRAESNIGKGENAGYHNVFYPSQSKFQLFSQMQFVVCKCFQFGPV